MMMATNLGKSKSVKICMLMQLSSLKVSFTLFRNYKSRASPENYVKTDSSFKLSIT